MSNALKTSEFACIVAFANLCGIFLLLALLQGTIGECAAPEQPLPPRELVPLPPGPLPSPQEQILAPIPRQFDWMRREVRPNPFLESLVLLREVTTRLQMSISLIEEYSDNFFLTERDPQEEYRTSVSIGSVYRVESGPSFVSLAASFRGAYDARAGEGNLPFANLALNTGYQLPRLALSLSESFIRSDEVAEASPAGVRRERRPFSQNIISPQLRYELTRTTAVTGAYTNILVWNEDTERDDADPLASNQGGIEEDSVTHALSTGLQHWFTRNLSTSVGYAFNAVDREDTADTQAHTVSADLAYIISPRTSTSFRAFGTLTDRDQGTSDARPGETDSQIVGASFRLRRQLTTSLAAFASAGPTLVDREGRPTRVFANWQLGLEGAVPLTRRTSLSLSTQQGIEDTAGDIDDVGLVLSQSAALTLNYSVSRAMLASVFADFSRTQLLEDIATEVSTQDRDFTLWSTGVRLSYALTPIWSLSLRYRYQQRDSDVPADTTINGAELGGRYNENRVVVSLSAVFPLF